MKSYTDRIFRVYLIIRSDGRLADCDAYTDKAMALSLCDALGTEYYTVVEKLVIRGEVRDTDA